MHVSSRADWKITMLVAYVCVQYGNRFFEILVQRDVFMFKFNHPQSQSAYKNWVSSLQKEISRLKNEADSAAAAAAAASQKVCLKIFFGLVICMDSLRGSSVRIGTGQSRLAWPLHKNDTHQSRSVYNFSR